jgi:hypothetical protein
MVVLVKQNPVVLSEVACGATQADLLSLCDLTMGDCGSLILHQQLIFFFLLPALSSHQQT